jgi:hypothetical protein
MAARARLSGGLIRSTMMASLVIAAGETKQWWGFITHLAPDSMVAPFVEGDILQIIFMAVVFGVALNAVVHIGGPVLDMINRLTPIPTPRAIRTAPQNSCSTSGLRSAAASTNHLIASARPPEPAGAAQLVTRSVYSCTASTHTWSQSMSRFWSRTAWATSSRPVEVR